MRRSTGRRRTFLRHCGESAEILEFSPYGYDERQYCSPGFNLAGRLPDAQRLGKLSRSITLPPTISISSGRMQLAGSLRVCAAIVDVLENNRRYRNLNPYCEPQLGQRNLYRSTGGEAIGAEINARLWVLNLSDGEHSLLDIAERSGLPFAAISDAAELLCQAAAVRRHDELEYDNGTLAHRSRSKSTIVSWQVTSRRSQAMRLHSCKISLHDLLVHRVTSALEASARSAQRRLRLTAVFQRSIQFLRDRSHMKILLTGHKGYIGAVAGPILRSAGHEVVGLDTDLFAGCDFGRSAPEIPEIRKDLRDLTQADLRRLRRSGASGRTVE